MSIFSFKKKIHKEETDFIIATEAVKRYPWGQVILQALLITMLIFGSFGGLLAAYGISYNFFLTVTVVFGLAVCYAAVYATEKRWLINLVLIGSLMGYFVYAFRSYWYVNSGYYGILNHILEVAREYLAIFNGTEYELVVTDEYSAVTYFAIFIGFIAVLLFSIRFSKSYGLVHVMLLTMPFYIIPMYFERNPGVGYLIILWAGYLLVTLLHAMEKGEAVSARWRYLLMVMVLFALCVRVFTAVVSPQIYKRSVAANPIKKESEKEIGAIVQSGFSSLFGGGSAGMSGGKLGNGRVNPDYETDLVVEYTPYSYEPIYLKGFLGVGYDGSRWIPPTELGLEEDMFTEETLRGLKEVAEEHSVSFEFMVFL